MGNVIDALRDMATDDEDQSNVEFAAAFQGKVRPKKGKKSRHPSREATTVPIDEEVERVFIPKSVVPWDIIDGTIKTTTEGKLRRVLMLIRSTPAIKRGRGHSVPIDVTDGEIVAFREFVAKCVKTRSYSYMHQKSMQRYAGLI